MARRSTQGDEGPSSPEMWRSRALMCIVTSSRLSNRLKGADDAASKKFEFEVERLAICSRSSSFKFASQSETGCNPLRNASL
jgi:hypothetical protein